MKKINLGVLVSGNGSNLQAIIDNIESGKLDAIIRVVISNVPGVRALERAKNHNIPAVVIDHENFSTGEKFDREAVAILKSHSIDLVILAGFMKILTPVFLRAFPGRIMNIHPALLPSFQGLHVQQKAFDYGVKFSGCTVHFVDDGVDTGPIIIQAVVPVYGDDTADILQQRILREEHRIYSQAIQFYAEGRLVIEGRKVYIRDSGTMETPLMHNPPLEKF
ncbi:MAG: phosphoribosylglycinamide formyltransferase [Deltaproteobacteria bacterium]|nr:phosphoribosylglycinamide formyltransferase [Deltaproteobacteria bacterium]MBW2648736.1 phosphoribosylglycinamide formyltransferase [Deltaproteobacteria bacterium]